MKTEKFTFPSADGTTTISAVRWMPEEGDAKAVLQITHGMVEYIDRYEPFAKFLTDKGYVVVGHDHLGHGDSIKSKEDWGYIGEQPRNLLVADMHRLRTGVQKEYPGLPYFMLGHSMGSYMLRNYLALHSEGLTGAIIMGTGYIPEATTKMAMTLAKTIAVFRGWRYRSKLIRNLSYSKPYKQYDLFGKDTKNSWLTKDEEIVKKYYADPRCTFVFTLNAYMGLFQAVQFSCRPENVKKVPVTLPLFIVSGKADPVGDLGVGVKKVYDMFKEAGGLDLTYELYDNDRHEILNELDKEKVYSDIASWMEIRLPQQ